jgi:hypothetical protein
MGDWSGQHGQIDAEQTPKKMGLKMADADS